MNGSSPIEVQRVTVVDVDMPFLSMVGFMIKWSLAAIPAAFILLMTVIMVLGVVRAGCH